MKTLIGANVCVEEERENVFICQVRDMDQYTPLHRAAYNNHADCVAYLLDLGADLNWLTEQGWTPLHCAACWGCDAVVPLLIGLISFSFCTSNATPTHEICACNEQIFSGGFPYKGCHSGDLWVYKERETLHMNSFHNLVLWSVFLRSMEQLFLERGADVNARSKGDLSPLHLAVACTDSPKGAVNVVKALLSTGKVEIDCVSGAKETPYMIARRSSKAMFELFEQYKNQGAQTSSDSSSAAVQQSPSAHVS